MEAKANPKAVGAFVVGAVLLAVAVAAVFGGGRYFTDRTRHVLFFEDTIQGLNVGSPVQFRGVGVGEVVDIRVVYEPQTFEITVAAIIDLGSDRIQEIGEITTQARDPVEEVEMLIEQGLRGRLATRSVVTGQQAIELVFLPDTEAKRIGLLPGDEIPTVPGGAWADPAGHRDRCA